MTFFIMFEHVSLLTDNIVESVGSIAYRFVVSVWELSKLSARK